MEIVAVLVFLFVCIALIRGPKEPRKRSSKFEDVCAKHSNIVADFGELLENGKILGLTNDISKLPHPKEVIKKSIFFLYLLEKDEKLKGHLTNGLLYLSSFQEGVGEQYDPRDYKELPVIERAKKMAEYAENTDKNMPNYFSIIQKAEFYDWLKELKIAEGQLKEK